MPPTTTRTVPAIVHRGPTVGRPAPPKLAFTGASPLLKPLLAVGVLFLCLGALLVVTERVRKRSRTQR